MPRHKPRKAGLLNLLEFSELAKINRNTTLDWIKKGVLRATKVGREWAIPESEVAEVIARRSPGLTSAEAEQIAAVRSLTAWRSLQGRLIEALRSSALEYGATPTGESLTRLRGALSAYDTYEREEEQLRLRLAPTDSPSQLAQEILHSIVKIDSPSRDSVASPFEGIRGPGEAPAAQVAGLQKKRTPSKGT